MQNFNPINLERKLDVERDREMVKFLWDECITHDFVRYMYKIKNYVVISKPNLTYQKANNIAKKFLKEDVNRINLLKYKIEEKFKLIHYIYSLLFSKIYNRTSQFGSQNKTTFDFDFQTWKSRKWISGYKNCNSVITKPSKTNNNRSFITGQKSERYKKTQ